jgi:hypothetical protein
MQSFSTFHNAGVASEDGLGFETVGSIRLLISVPETHLAVIRARQQVTRYQRAPIQSISLCIVTKECELWSESVVLGCRRVLGYIKYVNVGGGRLGCNNEFILRHISGSINFTLVINPHSNLNLSTNSTKTTKFTFLIIVLASIDLSVRFG